jgi:hypothetical protein
MQYVEAAPGAFLSDNSLISDTLSVSIFGAETALQPKYVRISFYRRFPDSVAFPKECDIL